MANTIHRSDRATDTGLTPAHRRQAQPRNPSGNAEQTGHPTTPRPPPTEPKPTTRIHQAARCIRAKAFYIDKIGFNGDVDVRPADGVRIIQLTPPGSACSILLSTGLPGLSDVDPGSVKGLHLVVADIETARAELIDRGVDVAPIDDVGGGVRYARFTDLDGNALMLQEMAWRTGENF